jgi:PAS domain-containing protein
MDKAGTLTIKEAKDASCGSVGCILPEQAPLNQQKYAFLFQHMLDGLAYCQVIFDSDGKPVDYVLSDVNDAFKKLTGLKDKPVVGKKLSEIFLGVKEKYF